MYVFYIYNLVTYKNIMPIHPLFLGLECWQALFLPQLGHQPGKKIEPENIHAVYTFCFSSHVSEKGKVLILQQVS